jgi:hypothetical protein
MKRKSTFINEEGVVCYEILYILFLLSCSLTVFAQKRVARTVTNAQFLQRESYF